MSDVTMERVQRNVLYALEIATAVASLYLVVRIAMGPDTLTRIKMSGARIVARTAKQQSELWTEVACKADTVYWQARNTVL